jgi:hypothetical protein
MTMRSSFTVPHQPLRLALALGLSIAAASQLSAAPGDQMVVRRPFFDSGFTSVVPLSANSDGLTDLLLYNIRNGNALYVVFDVDLNQRMVQVRRAPGWTAIVPLVLDQNVHTTDLVSYNEATGKAVYTTGNSRAWDSEPPQNEVQKLAREVDSLPGWTSIVPMNLDDDAGQLSDMLSYNRFTGRGVYSIGTGPDAEIQRVMSDVTDPAARGWTHILPLNVNNDRLTDLVWYNDRNGHVVYTIATGPIGAGPQANQKIVFDTATPEAIGWTSIVLMKLNDDDLTDMLSYNSRTGRAVFSIGTGVPESPQEIVKDTNVGAGWTAIVPMMLRFDGPVRTGLFFYNAENGNAQITRHCDQVTAC